MEAYELGDVRFVRLVDGSIDIDAPSPVPPWCVPDYAPGPATVELAFGAYGVQVDGLSIVVDPWLTTDGARSLPTAGEHADELARRLGAAGFAVDEVDLVVLSHFDGIGWSVRPTASGDAPMFPNARYVCSTSTIAARDAGDLEAPAGFDDLLDGGRVDAVDPGGSLAPHVTIAGAEGHTPGHVVVRVDTGERELVLAGHLFIFPNQVADPTIANDTDPDRAAIERRSLLEELAAGGGGVLFAQLLGGRGGGTVVADGDRFRLEPLEPVETTGG